MSARTPTASRTSHLRILTYNVHGCVGTDGRLDLQRVAKTIAQHEPDVVALQELDVARQRSGRLHQAKLLAEALKMEFHFHPAFLIKDDEQYGDAVLSRWPMELKHAGGLPSPSGRLKLEPRGALWVTIAKGEHRLQLINTHLGLGRAERWLQARALLGEQWLGHPDCQSPAVLCGDFNSLPLGRVHRFLSKNLRDAQRQLVPFRSRPTFPSRYPLITLDYFFLTAGLKVLKVAADSDPVRRQASDHLPLVADLELSDDAS